MSMLVEGLTGHQGVFTVAHLRLTSVHSFVHSFCECCLHWNVKF